MSEQKCQFWMEALRANTFLTMFSFPSAKTTGNVPERGCSDTLGPREKMIWNRTRVNLLVLGITTGWVTHKLENNYTTEAHPLE